MTDRFRVLITDRAWPDCEVEWRVLAEVGAAVVDSPSGDEATLVGLARDVDAIATCWAQVTPAVIRAAERLRVISRFGIGLDNISVTTATERRIPVTYVPDYCVAEVAEHALAMLFACARKVALFDRLAKRGEYNRQAGPPLRRVGGQTLGLIGFGRIGREVFRRAKGLGLNVVAYTPSGGDYETDCRMVSFDDLLRESDYVSLHLPLTDGTRHTINAAALERMKPSAYLINTSRGPLVDHDALWNAVQQGGLAGAALDVFDPEPPDLSQPFFQDERVLVTPHAAFLSVESLLELRTRTARQVATALQGLRPEHVVNPEVYAELD